MKKLYATLSIVTILAAFAVNAQSFTWNNYSNGSTSSSHSNSGITMSVGINGNGMSAGYPRYNSNGGGNLASTVDWSNKTSTVTYTFTFSKPVIGLTFLLFDVDQTSSWDDKLTITAKKVNNHTVYPSISGNSYTVVTGTNHNIIEGSANNENFANAPAVVSFGNEPVKTLTIVYGAGSSSPSNPVSQVVGFGSMVYENVLPVTLVSFKAEKKNNTTDLKWETENQDKFSHFELERSVNGSDQFEVIAKIPATSTSSASYTHTDAGAARLTQKAFYRLKMVDIDGEFKYSSVVVVTFENNPGVMVAPTLLNAGENITVNIAAGNQSRYEVKLLDMSGRILATQQGNSRMQFSTAGFRKGMYMVNISNENGSKTVRVMVQ